MKAYTILVKEDLGPNKDNYFMIDKAFPSEDEHATKMALSHSAY